MLTLFLHSRSIHILNVGKSKQIHEQGRKNVDRQRRSRKTNEGTFFCGFLKEKCGPPSSHGLAQMWFLSGRVPVIVSWEKALSRLFHVIFDA